MENGIQKELIGTIPSSTEVGTVEEMYHTALPNRRDHHSGTLLELFQIRF